MMEVNFYKNIFSSGNISQEKIDKHRDVILYGAGAMGRAAAIMLKNSDIKVLNIVDKSDLLRNTLIDGIKVIHPSDISEEKKQKCVFLVSMCAAPYFEIKEYLNSLGVALVYPVGDYIQKIYEKSVIANVWNFDNADKETIEKLCASFLGFNDELSKQNYALATKYFASRNEKMESADFKIEREKYFTKAICKMLRPNDVFLDTAALSGEYIERIKSASGQSYKSIYSFVLNLDNREFLAQKYQNDNIVFFNCEAGDSAGDFEVTRAGIMSPYTSFAPQHLTRNTIDEKMKNTPYNFLRAYSMSCILPVIRGAIHSIKESRPIIAINIGHYKGDFVNVFLYLKSELTDYNYYFRVHSYQGNDCILYAIPKVRLI